MKLKRVCKGIFLFFIFVVIILCFTFNAFAIDMPSRAQDPQIVIDGFDSETSWLESSNVNFSAPSNIAGMVSIEMLNYKNTVYGIINFTDLVESENDLIVRINFHYKKSITYVTFLMKNQLVLRGDGNLSVEGALNETMTGYCAEFSFSMPNNVFEQGDLVQLEVCYGNISELDDYENVYGFADIQIYDYYIGGKLPEPPSVVKPQGSGNNTKTTKPTKASTTVKSTTVKSTTVKSEDSTVATKFDVNAFSDYGYTDADETTIIISVMAAACIVLVIITLTLRKQDEEKKHNYSDDDKGCD